MTTQWDRWQAADRDSPSTVTFNAEAVLGDQLGALLQMEGANGLDDDEVLRVTGKPLPRARRWHKFFERIGLLYPGAGITHLTELGRVLRGSDAEVKLESRRRMGQRVLTVLAKYQLKNPADESAEESYPPDSDIHPYWAIWKAADELDGRLHWDELNRELMWTLRTEDLPAVIDRIRRARAEGDYDPVKGGSANVALRTRAYDQVEAPEGKDPDGQVRDQKTTPWFRRAGFGGLLLESPGSGGMGYWRIPSDMRDLVHAAVQIQPPSRNFNSEEEWFRFYGSLDSDAGVSWDFAAVLEQLQIVAPELDLDRKTVLGLLTALTYDSRRHFVILRGISGTGKTALTEAVARAVYGRKEIAFPLYTLVPVRPDWADSGPLLGAYSPLEKRYERPPFLEAVLYALGHSDLPIFLCLDEMNLARIEYYLAEVLSGMESGQPIYLDRQSDTTVPASFRWPSNVYLFGTVNIDESTVPISDKVLDRANVIQTDAFDLEPYLEKCLAEAAHLDRADRDRVVKLMLGAWNILRGVNYHFGFRTARAVVSFLDAAKSRSAGELSVDEILDLQFLQRVLPKLRGDQRWAETLSELGKLLSGLNRSFAAVDRMRTDLEHFGSFQFWS